MPKLMLRALTVAIVGLPILSASWVEAKSAQSKRPVVMTPYLVNAKQFAQLPSTQQIETLKALRAFLRQVEEAQSKRGVTYGTVGSMRPYPVWEAIAWLIQDAEAQTVREAGKPCIFAGNFTTYESSRPRSCGANFMRDLACKLDGGRWGVKCNPVLFGLSNGQPLCVRANASASVACEKERIDKRIYDEQLAKAISGDDPSGRAEAFNKLSNEFNQFCAGVMDPQNLSFGRPENDPNYSACTMMQKRLTNILASKSEPGSTGPSGASAPQETHEDAKTETVTCNNEKQVDCFTCQPVVEVKLEEISKGDPEVGQRYRELLEAMEAICPRRASTFIQSRGVCGADYDIDPAFAPVEVTDRNLVQQFVQAAKEKTGIGLYYQHPYSTAFEAYFGIKPAAAIPLFCGDGSQAPLNSFLNAQGAPEAIGFGDQAGLNGLREISQPLSSAPAWALNNPIKFPNNLVPSPDAFNRAARALKMRKKLQDCLSSNQSRVSDRGTRKVKEQTPGVCRIRRQEIVGTHILSETLRTLLTDADDPKGKPSGSLCVKVGSNPPFSCQSPNDCLNKIENSGPINVTVITGVCGPETTASPTPSALSASPPSPSPAAAATH